MAAFMGLVALTGMGMAEVVINEIELDAPDMVAQWVELYNSGDDNVSIGGWTITMIDGAWKGPMIIAEGTVIPAKGFYVSEGQLSWEEHKNATVTLINEAGLEVDQTPLLGDEGDDNFTNARVLDGQDTNTTGDWSYTFGSKGQSNNRMMVKA
ncbi:MAG: lamin tail domain-containing protein [Methanosarcinales archaeon]|nr:lamin tail domain-containing protein [Methanosarcinales archaeon]